VRYINEMDEKMDENKPSKVTTGFGISLGV
jgi:hypothetical protein